ncbi:hypothetical protein HC931_25625 [Candidatus Gracilibacteria bacterium]|nr:hypothetical protein [Candidatus Gracilibacteria bacterium]NJM90007.1 hypothetical protein [Hydrococcus sp. RU_2_2]NJP21902.1 hypothetical protein [Hydrococcus sp. CRU_1_1]
MWNTQDPQFKEYAARIVPLVKELGWTPAQIGQAIQTRYSQPTFCHLTGEQLEDLIDFLRSQLCSRQ